MRSRIPLGVVIVLVFRAALLAVGAREPAPRFHARTLDGEEFTNDSVRGKVVLIQFWTTWCPYCRKEQDAVDALVHDFGGKGLLILAVNVGESKKKVRQYLEKSPRACKIVLMEDTNLAALFAARSYPVYVLIDRDGNLAGRQDGAAGEDALRHLLSKAGLGSEENGKASERARMPQKMHGPLDRFYTSTIMELWNLPSSRPPMWIEPQLTPICSPLWVRSLG